MGLRIGLRTSELHILLCSQFKRETLSNRGLLVYQPIVGCLQGVSKDSPGGMRAARQAPQHITIFNISLCGGRLNAFEFITEYLQYRCDAGLKCERNFLTLRKRLKLDLAMYFKDQP